MSVDNNIKLDVELKSHLLEHHPDPSLLHKMPRCRSGASLSSSPPLKPSDLSTASKLFIPRAFPPPSLTGVPVEYIFAQLHNLAPHYWDKPDTADCTIVIPVPHPRGKAGSTFPDAPAFAMSSDPGLGRRVTEPALNSVPRISLKGLPVRALDLPPGAVQRRVYPRSHQQCRSLRGAVAAQSLWRVHCPRQPPPAPHALFARNTPILFLPIPDPSSIHLLVHWMYFGSTSYIEDSLNDGSVDWEGIARKRRIPRAPCGHQGVPRAMTVYYSDDEDQSDDEATDPSPAPARVDLSAAMAAADDTASDDDGGKRKRGRNRTSRPLSTCSSHSI
ncbi:hypothetical protein B0H14DRAFT_3878358 [Mycena olivaceomarginata]|nr:hypothetical protein B0H14DRAFT_3878358 [Mycena olivaceomarginata]